MLQVKVSDGAGLAEAKSDQIIRISGSDRRKKQEGHRKSPSASSI